MERPGFISALNAAIAAGFVLSYVVPPDLLIGWLLGGKDALDYIALADRLKFHLVLQYGATSALAFFLVRRLPFSGAQSVTLLVCNALLACSVSLRFWLATQDGAVLRATFAGADVGWAVALSSAALAVIELVPAAIIVGVFAAAAGRRFRGPGTADGSGPRWLAAAQAGIVALAGIAPVAYMSLKLDGGLNSPGAMGDAKAARFEALCATTRIEIRRKAADAKGVLFLDRIGSEEGLLKRLQFVEIKLGPGQERFGMSYLEYTRTGKLPLFIDNQFTGGIGPVPEPRAEYEVSSTRLEAASAREYAFHSSEVSIRDRRTGEVVAKYSYVMEGGNGPRRFCPRGFGGEEFRSHMVYYVFGAMEPEKEAWMERQLADFRKAATR